MSSVKRGGRRSQADPAVKSRAIELAASKGPTAAAKELSLNPSTVRAWVSQSKAGKALQTLPTDGDDFVAQLRRASSDAYQTAMNAQRAADRALKAGKAQAARDFSATHRVEIDQSGKLDAAADALEAKDIALAKDQRRLLAETVKTLLLALDLWMPAVRELTREVFHAVEDGKAVTHADLAERARAAVRKVVVSELEREGRRPPGGGTPAPTGPRPVTRGDSFDVIAEAYAAADEEVVDGEVVEVAEPALDGEAEARAHFEALYGTTDGRAATALARWRDRADDREAEQAELDHAWDTLAKEQQQQLLRSYQSEAEARKAAAMARREGRGVPGGPSTQGAGAAFRSMHPAANRGFWR
jgi:hypothetical protein